MFMILWQIATDWGGVVPNPSESDEDSAKASEWLSDNIREADAMDWEYDI